MGYLDKKTAMHCSPRAPAENANADKAGGAAAALQLQINGISLACAGVRKMKNEPSLQAKSSGRTANGSLQANKESPHAFTGSFQRGIVHEYKKPLARGENGYDKDTSKPLFRDFTVLEKRRKVRLSHPPPPQTKSGNNSNSRTHRGRDKVKSLSPSAQAKPYALKGSISPTAPEHPFGDAKALAMEGTLIGMPKSREVHVEKNGRTTAVAINDYRKRRAHSVYRPRYTYECNSPHPLLSHRSARRTRSSNMPNAPSLNENTWERKHLLLSPKKEAQKAEKEKEISSQVDFSRFEPTASVKVLGPLNSESRNELMLRRSEVFSAVRYAKMANDVQSCRPLHEFARKETVKGANNEDAKPALAVPSSESHAIPNSTAQNSNGGGDNSTAPPTSSPLAAQTAPGNPVGSPQGENHSLPQQNEEEKRKEEEERRMEKDFEDELRLIRKLRAAVSGPGGDIVLSQPSGTGKYLNTWQLSSTIKTDTEAIEKNEETPPGEVDYHACLHFLSPTGRNAENSSESAAFNDSERALRSTSPPVYSLTARPVILHDPHALLACEQLCRDAPNKPGDVGGEKIKKEDEKTVTSIIEYAPPLKEGFVRLSYAAKRLLAIVLYVRALGGLPGLLRVAPLPRESKVVGKENCLELVFWNPPRSTAAGKDETNKKSRGKRGSQLLEGAGYASSSGDAYAGGEATPLKANSLLRRLSHTLSSISGANSVERIPNRTTGREEAVLSTTSERNLPFSNDLSQTLPPKPPRSRRSSVLFDPFAEEEVTTPLFSSRRKSREEGEYSKTTNENANKPAKYSFEHGISPRRSGGKTNMANEKETFDKFRTSSLFYQVGISTKTADELRFDPEDEVCVVVRAVLAERRRVRCFGREEVVYILPPLLPNEEEEKQTENEKKETRLMDSVDKPFLSDSAKEPFRRFLLKDTQKMRADERRQANRNLLHGTRNAMKFNLNNNNIIEKEDHIAPAEDFGDFAIAFLLGCNPEESETKKTEEEGVEEAEVLPSAEELVSWRYRIYDLQGYVAEGRDLAGKRPNSPRQSPAFIKGARSLWPFLSSERERPHTAEGNYRHPIHHNNSTITGAILKENPHQYDKRLFPRYCAATLSETTLRHYHDEAKRFDASRANSNSGRNNYKSRRSTHEDAAFYSPEASPSLGSPRQASSSARGIVEDAERRKTQHLLEFTRDLFRFRPFNFNGFYEEFQTALQHKIDAQVRLAKGKVVNAFHM